jgi:predicted nicotinamide N-methyase
VGCYKPVHDRSRADIDTIHRVASLLTIGTEIVRRREMNMEHLEFGRRLWTGLTAAAAYLMKRPEVVKGVASLAVFVGKSQLLQFIQTL